MFITKQGIKYEYKCSVCGIDYIEQRHLNEAQFFTTCQVTDCGGDFNLVNTTEFSYEQEIPDPVVVTEEVIPTPESEEPVSDQSQN